MIKNFYRIAVKEFNISPIDFWNMSLKEFLILTEENNSIMPMTKEELLELQKKIHKSIKKEK